MSSLQVEEVTLKGVEELAKELEEAPQSEWTPQEEAVMRRIYPIASKKRRVRELAKLLGRTQGAVQQKAARMGLTGK